MFVVKTLAEERDRNDVLTPEEFEKIYNITNTKKIDWLVDKEMKWKKKTGIKNLTTTFNKLIESLPDIAVASGSSGMPFCLVSKDNYGKLKILLKKLYKNRLDENVMNFIGHSNNHLAIVFIAGFKPRGDDPRPDRGLTPLVKMLLGREGYDVLTVVYGPAPKASLKLLKKDQDRLCKSNGLWESIISLSDVLLVDTPTMGKADNVLYKTNRNISNSKPSLLVPAFLSPKIGEHDVDTVLHILFTQQDKDQVFESMCNPPGGDWSGISILNFNDKSEFRWTSLPRVSGEDMKRPDHLIQFNNDNLLLVVESKEKSSTLETAIGPRLKKYIKYLISHKHTTFRLNEQSAWDTDSDIKFKNNLSLLSCSAFVYNSKDDLLSTLKRGETEVAIGVEFDENKKTIVHIASSHDFEVFLKKVKLNKNISKLLEIKYYFIQ